MPPKHLVSSAGSISLLLQLVTMLVQASFARTPTRASKIKADPRSGVRSLNHRTERNMNIKVLTNTSLVARRRWDPVISHPLIRFNAVL